MHCESAQAAARYRIASGIVEVIVLLATVTSLAGVSTAASQATSEPAPQVKSAVDGVLDLFKKRLVVALGDAHGMAQEEAFYSAVVRDPRFADEVGNVVVEFGDAAWQSTIDRYVAGEDVPFTELRRVWTDTAGAGLPKDPVYLGDINFFADVRAANLKLAPEHRIKVWLGDPKIDWSGIHSFQDFQPYLRQRDDNIFRIISEEILKKQKKTLLIMGIGHFFGPGGPGPLSAKISEAFPNALAVVSPFIGYVEPECNAKFVARAQSWPVPAIVAPIAGTWLKSELALPGCNYVPPAYIERMKKMAAARPPGARILGPGKLPSPTDMIAAQISILSGANADAILYLGPPETLTESLVDPSLYLDLDYFKEIKRRAQYALLPGMPAMDWDQLVQGNSVTGRKFKECRWCK
jgi:hypothetical protein